MDKNSRKCAQVDRRFSVAPMIEWVVPKGSQIAFHTEALAPSVILMGRLRWSAWTKVSWRRLDNGSKPQYSKIEVVKESVVRRGDAVDLMKDDMHSVENRVEKPSLSLHIYGKSLARTSRSEFGPETDTQKPYLQRERTRVQVGQMRLDM